MAVKTPKNYRRNFFWVLLGLVICIALVYVVDCYIAWEQHVLIRSLSAFFVCIVVAAGKIYYRYIREKRKENCKSTARHNVYDEDYHRVCERQTHLSRDYEHFKEANNNLKAENDDLKKQLKEKDSHIARMTRRLSSKRTELARLNQANERKDSEIKMHEGTAKIQGLELQQLQEQLATREKEVTSLNNELSTKEAELQEVHEKLAAYQEELTTLADQMIHKEQELEHCQEILAALREQIYQGLDELFISHDEALSQLEEAVYLNFLLNHSSLSTFSCAGVIHISYSIDEEDISELSGRDDIFYGSTVPPDLCCHVQEYQQNIVCGESDRVAQGFPSEVSCDSDDRENVPFSIYSAAANYVMVAPVVPPSPV